MYLLTALRSLSWNSIDLTKELTVSTKATKKNFINLQWVVALGTSYLLFSGSNRLAESPWELIIIALLLASVLALYNLPPSVFSQTIFTCVLTMTDTLFVVVGIALSKESPWDLFLILFFGMFIAAIGESFIKIVCGCLFMSSVFLVLDVLLEKIKTLLPYSAATITLLNKGTGIFEPIACWNISESNWKSIPNIESDLEDAAVTNAPVVVRKAQANIPSPIFEFLQKEGLVSYLRVPLVVREEALGSLTFFTKEEREFDKQEIQFLSTLASQAAIGTYNSQLYECTKRQAAELEQANKEKDESLGIISHELRTPLSVALGCVSLIKDGVLGDINLEQKKILEKAIGCTNDQLVMLNSLLDTTALESGSIKVDRQEIDLDAFLAEMKASHENPLRKELSLIWDYPPDLPIIRTDSHKLKLILQNLINNAIKYTPTGHIRISARYLAEQKEVKFAVADTGIGIPKDSLTMIFDKFRQLGGSEAKNYGGIGLGLYIVKRYTEVIGGRVDVESELGKGSIFAVTLPCKN